MARQRNWDSLSPAYRARLARNGITKNLYELGVNVSSARGHRNTPEHGISQALRHPTRFRKYLDKKNVPTGPRGRTLETAEEQAHRLNDVRDKAYANIRTRLGNYLKYNDHTVRNNVYGGRTVQGGDVPGMSYVEAFWTSTADTEEIRSRASEQFTGNPWFYH